MSTRISLPRAVARLGALLVGVVTAGLIGLPTAHAATNAVEVNLVLAPGQSGSIGTVVSNTNVTPVSTCDPGLSVTFDATMAGTVTVAPGTPVGAYTCSVDFQVSGQSVGLFEHVSVDVVPGLSIEDVGVLEGSPPVDPGTQHVDGTTTDPAPVLLALPNVATFTVTMAVPSTGAVTVNLATADGNATAPSDYTAVSTTLTFAPGQTSATVDVPIVADDSREFDETFSVVLSAPTDAVLIDGQATGFILNDDNPLGTADS